METRDNFYDEEKGLFNIQREQKIAQILGEEIDNPKETFKKVENLYDKRIDGINRKLCEVNKIHDAQKDDYNSLQDSITNNFEQTEQDGYFKIKGLFGDFEQQNELFNSEYLILQKYLTQLTKEKMDLGVQIKLCANQGDNLEKYLGINIASKRTKKNGNKK